MTRSIALVGVFICGFVVSVVVSGIIYSYAIKTTPTFIAALFGCSAVLPVVVTYASLLLMRFISDKSGFRKRPLQDNREHLSAFQSDEGGNTTREERTDSAT